MTPTPTTLFANCAIGFRPWSNEAPAPNRRPRFPLGGLVQFEYVVCAPPISSAAVGEAQRYEKTPELNTIRFLHWANLPLEH